MDRLKPRRGKRGRNWKEQTDAVLWVAGWRWWQLPPEKPVVLKPCNPAAEFPGWWLRTGYNERASFDGGFVEMVEFHQPGPQLGLAAVVRRRLRVAYRPAVRPRPDSVEKWPADFFEVCGG